MRTRLGAGVLFLVALAFSSGVDADLIYDNGNYDPSYFGSNSTVELSLNPDWISFDDFILTENNSVLMDIHWWGNYYLYYSDQLHDGFEIYIYGDANGAPDLSSSALYSIDGAGVIRTPTGDSVPNGQDVESPVFAYDLLFDPIVLDPGVTYWLAITNGFYWYWQPSTETGTAYQVVGTNFPGNIAGGEDDLEDLDYELAFNLTGGVVPEPSSVVLLGAGLAALLMQTRMRRFFR